MQVYFVNIYIYIKYQTPNISYIYCALLFVPFRHFFLKLLQNNFNIWIYQSNLVVRESVANCLLLLLLLFASYFTCIVLSIWMVIVLFPVIII